MSQSTPTPDDATPVEPYLIERLGKMILVHTQMGLSYADRENAHDELIALEARGLILRLKDPQRLIVTVRGAALLLGQPRAPIGLTFNVVRMYHDTYTQLLERLHEEGSLDSKP